MYNVTSSFEIQTKQKVFIKSEINVLKGDQLEREENWDLYHNKQNTRLDKNA